MGHTRDSWERVRRTVLPVLDFIFGLFGGYAEGSVIRPEYVGTIDVSGEEFEKTLHEMGFVRNPGAALKHESWDKDDYEDGSWAKRKSVFAHWQLHVTIFSDGEETHVFAHWELSWIRHPIAHYRGDGFNAKKGRDMMRDQLRSHGVEFDTNFERTQ